MTPDHHHHWAPGRRATAALVTFAVLAWGGAAQAEGDEPLSAAQAIVDALVGGQPTLNMRARIELANSDASGIERSEAYTLRTRLGYGTKPLHGVRIYADFENIATLDKSTYFYPTDLPNDDMQTVVADPPSSEVNQAFAEIARPDWFGSKLKGGRQRLILDDARFVGNVGWRQNEQTYDGVWFTSSAGVDDLSIGYGWLAHVHRIFGGGGNNPALDDFSSNSHLVRVSYGGLPYVKLSAFAYWLDLEARAQPEPAEDAASSATFGIRAHGKVAIGDAIEVDYLASYAHQKDHADNATDYEAAYGHGVLGVRLEEYGRVAAGFEYLGSDDGMAVFGTPLATAHKFNGWADVYLNNGGPAGLQDLYFQVAPKLPFDLKMLFVYHRFWDAEDDIHRGDEYDVQLKRPITPNWSVLAKGAYFDSKSDDFAEVDLWRVWLETTFQF